MLGKDKDENEVLETLKTISYYLVSLLLLVFVFYVRYKIMGTVTFGCF